MGSVPPTASRTVVTAQDRDCSLAAVLARGRADLRPPMETSASPT